MKIYNKKKLYKSNLIFVTGYCGSGKSTYGRELARKLNFEYVSLDIIEPKYYKEVFKNSNMGTEDLHWTEEKYVNGLIDYIVYTYDKAVIEGIDLLYCSPSKLKDYPVVLMDTNIITSTTRALKRDVKIAINRLSSLPRTNIMNKKNITKLYNELGGKNTWQ